MNTPARPAERGSVIIWILVCVAMFAALSFTVANMMRGGGAGMTKELLRSHAAEIISYGEGIRRAVQTVRVSGINLSAVSFENDFVSGYENANCGDDTCRIFMPAGGGVSYVEPNIEWIDISKDGEEYYREWHIAPDSCIPDVGTGDATCGGDTVDNEELTLFMPYIKQSLCVEINRQAGITNTNGAPPQDAGCPWTTATQQRFIGTFVDAQSVTSAPPEILAGRQNGCFRMGACGTYPANVYVYYQVLVAR
jgi:hypothetical protein